MWRGEEGGGGGGEEEGGGGGEAVIIKYLTYTPCLIHPGRVFLFKGVLLLFLARGIHGHLLGFNMSLDVL